MRIRSIRESGSTECKKDTGFTNLNAEKKRDNELIVKSDSLWRLEKMMHPRSGISGHC